MSEHDFKPVPNSLTKNGMVLWRCDQCDSEAYFKMGREPRYVNQFMRIKMPCLAKLMHQTS